MKRKWRVAVIVDAHRGFGRGILQGVGAYIRLRHNWSVEMPDRNSADVTLPWLQNWTGDGIMARAEHVEVATAIQKRNLPCVELTGLWPKLRIEYVDTDVHAAAVGALAFEHLRERGFRQFAYCGYPGLFFSDERCTHFVKRVKAAGFPCSDFEISSRRRVLDWHQFHVGLAQWLARLPKPVGVMTCNDSRGRDVVQACRQSGIDVPHDVAVVGVDNDEVICGFSDPPLSSVIPNSHRLGFIAARVLEDLMRGRRPPKKPYSWQPLGVVTRASSDVLAIEDSDVSAALRFIRQHACDPIQVRDVLTQVPLSWTLLERRFKSLVGHSPKAEITRVQIARVKQLLAETDLPLKHVSAQAGFASADYLHAVFKKGTSQTPGQYRASIRWRTTGAVSV